MSQLKLTADGGGGTVSLKGPSTTTGNAAIELTVPGTGSSTLATTATAGKILQVKSISKLDTFSVSASAGQYYDVTGLNNLQITTTGSNKVIVYMTVHMGIDNDGYNGFFKGVRITSGTYYNLSYNSTSGTSYRASEAGVWTHSGNVPKYHTHAMHIVGFEDSPGAGTHQYGIQISSSYTAAIYTGRPYAGEATGHVYAPSGTITLMEVEV